ncbi:MAG: hypothetical protein EZS28_021915, partial [Streblomastix strix]
ILSIINSSIGPVTNTPNITQGFQCNQQGNKIVHTPGNNNSCVVTYNPVISSGIVRFEGYFQNTIEYRIIGIADASTVFNANRGPRDEGNYSKSIRFDGTDGGLWHISPRAISGLSRFLNNQKVACEVNMDKHQIQISESNASFTLTRFERLTISSAKNVELGLEWGTEWVIQQQQYQDDCCIIL